MIRVALEATRVESEWGIKTLEVGLPLCVLTKKSGEIILQLPVLESH